MFGCPARGPQRTPRRRPSPPTCGWCCPPRRLGRRVAARLVPARSSSSPRCCWWRSPSSWSWRRSRSAAARSWSLAARALLRGRPPACPRPPGSTRGPRARSASLAGAAAAVAVTGVLPERPPGRGRRADRAATAGGRPGCGSSASSGAAGRRGAGAAARAVRRPPAGWTCCRRSGCACEGRLGPAAARRRRRGRAVRRGARRRCCPAPSRVQRVAGRLRAGLRAAAAPLPAAEQGLLPALVVGDTSRLPDELRADFRTVGLTHLTAVSGSNVAIVLAAVLLVWRRAPGSACAGAPVARRRSRSPGSWCSPGRRRACCGPP